MVQKITAFFVMYIVIFMMNGGRNYAQPPTSTPCQTVRYSTSQLLFHACERLIHDQRTVLEVDIVNPKLFGIDPDNAVLYGNFHVITTSEEWHIPQIYPLVLRTTNKGQTWMHVLDPLEHRISTFVGIQFIDQQHGWLHWHHSIGDSVFGMLWTQNGGLTWHESIFTGIQGNSSLVQWGFSSPSTGRGLVDSHFGVPVDESNTTEVAYWIVETQTGGRTWDVVTTISTEDENGLAFDGVIPNTQGVESHASWQIHHAEESFRILSLSENGQWQTIFAFPQQLYNAKHTQCDKESIRE